MLFRRRVEARGWERLRGWMWPRAGFRRSALYYLKRTLRLSGSPYAVAMGSAIGAAVSFTPLLGFHLLITFALAWAARANLMAGAIASCIGNPLTFPFIWVASYEIGDLILHGGEGAAPERLGHELSHRSLAQVWPVIEPMLVGSIPLALAAGCIVYVTVHKAVSAYQARRRRHLSERRQAGSEGVGALG